MLAFSNDYYGLIFRATQSVELFCTYVLFDFDDFEDDENESYHKNMFESDDIEGGENL